MFGRCWLNEVKYIPIFIRLLELETGYSALGISNRRMICFPTESFPSHESPPLFTMIFYDNKGLFLISCFMPTIGICFAFVLLRYNVHAIKFTLFNHTIQWFLVYSQGCVIINIIQF